MLTITYHGPTAHKGARLTCKGSKRHTVGFHPALNQRENAQACLRAYLSTVPGHEHGTWMLFDLNGAGWGAVRITDTRKDARTTRVLAPWECGKAGRRT